MGGAGSQEAQHAASPSAVRPGRDDAGGRLDDASARRFPNASAGASLGREPPMSRLASASPRQSLSAGTAHGHRPSSEEGGSSIQSSSSSDGFGPNPPSDPFELTFRDRALAAGASAVLSAVIMNPLDVAKTRLQAQAAVLGSQVPCDRCSTEAGADKRAAEAREGGGATKECSRAPGGRAGEEGGGQATEGGRALKQGSRSERPTLGSTRGSIWRPTHGIPTAQQRWEGRHRPWAVSVKGVPYGAGPGSTPHWARPSHVALEGAAYVATGLHHTCGPPAYRGPLDVFFRVVREEGFTRLWRGTNASLIMAVPSVGIYMPLYDLLRADLEQRAANQGAWIAAPYAPLVAGSVARSVACVACAPLELARTRMQAHREPTVSLAADFTRKSPTATSASGIWDTMRRAMDLGGETKGAGHRWSRVWVLWRGVDAQLARDVPFSAICWSVLEPTRRQLLGNGQQAGRQPLGNGQQSSMDLDFHQQRVGLTTIVAANFGAGVIAGSIAAAATAPLDVVKTRTQIEHSPVGVLPTLLRIWREGGARALFAGAGPRTLRAGPSVGIIVSFYELMKHCLGESKG